MAIRLVAVGVVALVGAVALGPAAAHAAPGPGQTTLGTVAPTGVEYRYRLYTPTTYRAARPGPLVVVVHGCQTTAEQEQEVTQYDRLAERDGFVVVYADVDAAGRAQIGPLANCWKIGDPSAYRRGTSDTAAIAAMTRAAMGSRAVDPERVYAVGVSAGGLMVTAQAAAYPELYAAVGVVETTAYADLLCFGTGTGIPAAASAAQAFAQLGPRARVVPRVVIGSTGDRAFPAPCARKALEQGLRTDNLVLSGTQTAPLSLAPAAVRRAQQPGGYPYATSTFRDPDGCVSAELTIVDGMPHAWPGGTADPAFAGYSDPKAPSGAELTWGFFRRYTKAETAVPCAEAPVAGTSAGPDAPVRCAARSILVRLPARSRVTAATVNGRAVGSDSARGGVRLTVPAGVRARTAVHVVARASGSRVVRDRTAPGCGP